MTSIERRPGPSAAIAAIWQSGASIWPTIDRRAVGAERLRVGLDRPRARARAPARGCRACPRPRVKLRELGLPHRPPRDVRERRELRARSLPDRGAVARVRERRVEAAQPLEPRLERGLALAARPRATPRGRRGRRRASGAGGRPGRRASRAVDAPGSPAIERPSRSSAKTPFDCSGRQPDVSARSSTKRYDAASRSVSRISFG